MAAQHFEANRQTDLSVYLNRLLEKCYKDSKCIDLESLCIVVEEKVNMPAPKQRLNFPINVSLE